MFGDLWEQFTESYSTAASYYGVYGVMFLLALLYLIIRKTPSWKRAVMVYTLFVMVVLVLFNPVYYKILTKVVSSYDVYYRLFWMIPFDIVIGYVCVDIVATIKEGKKRVVFALSVLIVLVAGGDLVYSFDGGSVKATYFGTIYKVNQQVVDITDAIVADDKNGNKKTISSTDGMFALRGYDALFGIAETSSMESVAVNTDALVYRMQAVDAGYAVIEKGLCEGDALVEDGRVQRVLSTEGYEVYVLVN
jgi:hypothetical protein